jgi:hypothetical protein
VFKGFDEVRRLGLRQQTEAVARLAKARSHGAPGKVVVNVLATLSIGSSMVGGVAPHEVS